MEVVAGVSLINTVNAQQQESITTREVSALPVGRRTLSDVMTLGAGIVNAGLGRLNFNGLGASAANFTMDGIDASTNPQAPQAQFKEGQNAHSLGLTGKETLEIAGLNRGAAKFVKVIAKTDEGTRTLTTEFDARLRIDTPKELDYYQHGGILQYVLRQLAAASKAA